MSDNDGDYGCLTPWDVQSRRIYRDDGCWPTLYGGDGGGKGYVIVRNDMAPKLGFESAGGGLIRTSKKMVGKGPAERVL